MGGEDPLKIEALERGPLIDYWFALNNKLEEIARIERQKKQSRAGSNRTGAGHQ